MPITPVAKVHRSLPGLHFRKLLLGTTTSFNRTKSRLPHVPLLISVIGLLFTSQAFAGWVRQYPGTGGGLGSAYAVAVDDSGYVYVAGVSYPPGSNGEMTTIKYSGSGDTVWVRRYGGSGVGPAVAYDLELDPAGNVLVAGKSSGIGYSDMTTIKYSPTGDTLWVRRFSGGRVDGEWAKSIDVDADANVYVTGPSRAANNGDDYLTIKYSPVGDTLWTRRYNGPGNGGDMPWDMVVDEGGNVYVTGGVSGDSLTDSDIGTVKYLPNGDTGWVRLYNGPASWIDGGYAVAVSDSGFVYVAGVAYGNAVEDYATIKYSADGDTIWVRYYDNGSADYSWDLVVDNAGNVIVTGMSKSAANGWRFATVKYTPAGDTIWTRRYEDFGGSAEALTVDDSGCVYVTGRIYGATADGDILTIKYSPAGDTEWQRRYNGPANKNDLGISVVADLSANVYVVGWVDGWWASHMVTIKYSNCAMVISGDLTGDELVTSADVITLVNYVFKSGPEPQPCAAAGDADCTGNVTSSDIIHMVNYVFKGGPSPCDVCTLIPGTWPCP